jgi:hypothetical protein
MDTARDSLSSQMKIPMKQSRANCGSAALM